MTDRITYPMQWRMNHISPQQKLIESEKNSEVVDKLKEQSELYASGQIKQTAQNIESLKPITDLLGRTDLDAAGNPIIGTDNKIVKRSIIQDIGTLNSKLQTLTNGVNTFFTAGSPQFNTYFRDIGELIKNLSGVIQLNSYNPRGVYDLVNTAIDEYFKTIATSTIINADSIQKGLNVFLNSPQLQSQISDSAKNMIKIAHDIAFRSHNGQDYANPNIQQSIKLKFWSSLNSEKDIEVISILTNINKEIAKVAQNIPSLAQQPNSKLISPASLVPIPPPLPSPAPTTTALPLTSLPIITTTSPSSSSVLSSISPSSVPVPPPLPPLVTFRNPKTPPPPVPSPRIPSTSTPSVTSPGKDVLEILAKIERQRDPTSSSSSSSTSSVGDVPIFHTPSKSSSSSTSSTEVPISTPSGTRILVSTPIFSTPDEKVSRPKLSASDQAKLFATDPTLQSKLPENLRQNIVLSPVVPQSAAAAAAPTTRVTRANSDIPKKTSIRDILNAKKGQGIPSQTKKHAYKVRQDGSYGDVIINLPQLFGYHKLIVMDGEGDIKMTAKVDQSFVELITKRYNPKVAYSQPSIKLFNKLNRIAGLPIHKGSGKYKMTNEDIHKKIYRIITNPDELVARLEILTGQIGAGNDADEVRNETSEVLDKLLEFGTISKAQHKLMFKKFCQ